MASPVNYKPREHKRANWTPCRGGIYCNRKGKHAAIRFNEYINICDKCMEVGIFTKSKELVAKNKVWDEQMKEDYNKGLIRPVLASTI